MYPHVSLTIDNQIPSIIYHPEEGVRKKLNTKDENIYNVVSNIAQKLGITQDDSLNEEEQYQALLAAARESDENYLTELTDINHEVIDFDLHSTMNNAIEKALKNKKDNYVDIELSDELKEELILNQNKDILASLLDAMYLLLISKTVVAAAELGIGKIALYDSNRNVRLHEKMLKELDSLGIEYITDLPIPAPDLD